MTKRFFALLLVAVLTLSMGACSATTPEEPAMEDRFDPSLVYFEKPVISDSSLKITVNLKNDSESPISVGGTFSLSRGDVLRAGTLNSVTVSPGGTAAIPFDFAALNLTEGSYSVSVTYTRVDPTGTLQTGDLSFLYSYHSAETPDQSTDSSTDISTESLSDTVDPPTENRDIMTTPIAYMTHAETEELAQYLFEYYVPCCFGIFESTAALSSPSIWASVEVLNSVVDKDTSEESRTLEAVQKKVEIYYPGSNFNAEDVRLYDETTKTFRQSPSQVQKYTYLACERKGDTIAVYYQDIPEDPDTEPGQYATTLKKSSESGYFSFVSTVRVGAVG